MDALHRSSSSSLSSSIPATSTSIHPSVDASKMTRAQWLAKAIPGENRQKAVEEMDRCKNLLSRMKDDPSVRGDIIMDLSSLGLKTAPPDEMWEGLNHVEGVTLRVRLNGNQLNSVPPGIGKATAITGLNLANNEIKTLPDEIGALKNMTALALHNNKITHLPPTIGKLTKLQSFWASGNQLKELPDEIGKCTALIRLVLSGNKLEILPEEAMGKLIHLYDVDLNHNCLKKLPGTLGNCKELECLQVAYNDLQDVPKSLGECKALVEFKLNNNRIRQVPDIFSTLPALAGVDLEHNEITAVPNSIRGSAAILHVGGNPLSLPVRIALLRENRNVLLAPMAGAVSAIATALSKAVPEKNYDPVHIDAFAKYLYSACQNEFKKAASADFSFREIHTLYTGWSEQFAKNPKQVPFFDSLIQAVVATQDKPLKDTQEMFGASANKILENPAHVASFSHQAKTVPVTAPSLNQAVALYSSSPEQHRGLKGHNVVSASNSAHVAWPSEIASEPHAQEFANWLGALHETSYVGNPKTKAAFRKDMNTLLDAMKEDPKLRAGCFKIAGKCRNEHEFQIAGALQQMERFRLRHDIISRGRNGGDFDKQARAHLLTVQSIVSKKVETGELPFTDPIEAYYAHVSQLSDHLKVAKPPISSPESLAGRMTEDEAQATKNRMLIR